MNNTMNNAEKAFRKNIHIKYKMFQIAQNNHQWNVKYYELMENFNHLKSESDNKIRINSSEIEHLNKMVIFLKNKNVESSKTIIEKNKHILSLITKLNESQH
jgi:hypothetical protein